MLGCPYYYGVPIPRSLRLGDFGLQNRDGRVASDNDDTSVNAVTALRDSTVGAGVTRVTAVENLAFACEGGHVQHISRSVADKPPNTPLECVTIPVTSPKGEAVVDILIPERNRLVHHVDQEKEAAMAGLGIAATLVAHDVIVTSNEPVFPSSYGDIARV